MKPTAFAEAFDKQGRWLGTATLETIRKLGLDADLRWIMYGRESLAVDGWACRARTD
jgi:hypothetical protein